MNAFLRRVQCICMGTKLPHTEGQCAWPATQEDFLCDWCRDHQCWTVADYSTFYERFAASAVSW